MGETLGPREILEIAVHVEEHGEHLYEAFEKKAENETLKLMWCFLKEQEILHRKIFSDMIQEALEKAFDYGTGEYSDYFNTVSDNYIFTQKLVEQKKHEFFSSDLEAVEFGIYIEKESILTYTALKDYLPIQQQAIVDKVIKEEQDHLVRLSKIRNGLKKGA